MTVNWLTREVIIPQEDLIFVSGSLYRGDTNALRILIKGAEASEEGIVFPDINKHNTEVGPIVGTTYARTIEIINGYSLTFSPNSSWSVLLEGSNNNMWDIQGGVLNQNQVQVIPTNSAGLIYNAQGSLQQGDIDDIVDGVWDELLTGASHNIPASAGRRLRQLGDAISCTVDDVSATTTSFITDCTENRDDFFNDQLVRFTTGNLEGHVRVILDYNGTTKEITVSEAMIEAPDDDSEFDIIPDHIHPIGQISDAVWDELIIEHLATGTTGKELKKALKTAQFLALKNT